MDQILHKCSHTLYTVLYLTFLHIISRSLSTSEYNSIRLAQNSKAPCTVILMTPLLYQSLLQPLCIHHLSYQSEDTYLVDE